MMFSGLDNLRAAIVAQPWRSLGLAFLAGAYTALARARNPLVRAAADNMLATILVSVRDAMNGASSAVH